MNKLSAASFADKGRRIFGAVETAAAETKGEWKSRRYPIRDSIEKLSLGAPDDSLRAAYTAATDGLLAVQWTQGAKGRQKTVGQK